MPWIGELAAIGTSLCFSFSSTFFTASGRQIGSIIVNRGRLLMAVLFVMLWHTLAFGHPLPLDAGADRWLWLGLSGFVGLVLGDTFLFQAFILIGPRLSMLMMALAPVLGVVLAWLFLHESLSGQELLGIAVTLAGILAVIAERSGGDTTQPADRRHYIIGLLCGLGGAAGQAGGLVLSKIGMGQGFPPLSASIIRLLVAMLVAWLLALLNRQFVQSVQTLRTHPRAFFLLSGGAILGPVIGVWLSLVSVQNTSVGVSSTLSSLMPIFLIPISYVLYKERITKQAVIGTLIAFAGMVLLFV